jgi:hypothetical protein
MTDVGPCWPGGHHAAHAGQITQRMIVRQNRFVLGAAEAKGWGLSRGAVDPRRKTHFRVLPRSVIRLHARTDIQTSVRQIADAHRCSVGVTRSAMTSPETSASSFSRISSTLRTSPSEALLLPVRRRLRAVSLLPKAARNANGNSAARRVERPVPIWLLRFLLHSWGISPV